MIKQLEQRAPTIDEARAAYGGEAKSKTPTISNLGDARIEFSRTIFYPNEIVDSEFLPKITKNKPPVIKIQLSEEDKRNIEELKEANVVQGKAVTEMEKLGATASPQGG